MTCGDSLLDSAGEEVDGFSRNLLGEGGRLRTGSFLPFNLTPGEYRVEVRDVLSDRVLRHKLTVQ